MLCCVVVIAKLHIRKDISEDYHVAIWYVRKCKTRRNLLKILHKLCEYVMIYFQINSQSISDKQLNIFSSYWFSMYPKSLTETLNTDIIDIVYR